MIYSLSGNFLYPSNFRCRVAVKINHRDNLQFLLVQQTMRNGPDKIFLCGKQGVAWLVFPLEKLVQIIPIDSAFLQFMSFVLSYGAQRIATYLTNLGYRTRAGKPWHHATIRGILCNLTYTGVLRCGESRSQVIPELKIIEPELFEAAQHIRTNRAQSAEAERTVPRKIGGQSLLSGNVYCGHCGARLSLTTSGKAYPCKADPNRTIKRIRYICYGKTRKQTECDGPTGYTAHILDDIIDKLVRGIFERMRAVPKSEIVNVKYREKMEERKTLLQAIRADYNKAAADLESLRGEVIKAIHGESAFSKELLGSLIAEAETTCTKLQSQLDNAQADYDNGKAILAALNAQYDDIISWADMYDTASMDAKRMIVNCLIKRVDVYRDYKIHVEFAIGLEQFNCGLDQILIPAA